jgi:DNA-binding NtrC family response regulator
MTVYLSQIIKSATKDQKTNGCELRKKILVVENGVLMPEFMAQGLSAKGFDLVRADSLSKSFLEILKSPPDIILADCLLRDGTAFDLLTWLKSRDARIPLIVLSAHTSNEQAAEAIKNGAEYFLSKPIDLVFLTTVLCHTLENFRNLQKDLASNMGRARYHRDPFLGVSPAIQKLKKAAKRISETNSTVLIQGETGTGKSVLAKWLHRIGPRSKEAFVDLNCAGLSHELLESEIFGHLKGAFTGAVINKIGFLEAANHGTLFLDEIGDMDLQVQPKILKVVEDKLFYRLGDVHERMVDVQIIVATHRNLKKLIEDGKFRNDLYFRISTFCLRIPPLRERPEDILFIIDKLLEQFSWDLKRGPLRISDNARSALQHYSWPGNIRELRNVLERSVLLSDNGVINEADIAFEVPIHQCLAANVTDSSLTLKEMERRYILQILKLEGGRVPQAAKRLGISKSSLYAKIHEYAFSRAFE